VKPDEQLGLPIGQSAHGMRVPDFLEKRRWHGGCHDGTTRRDGKGGRDQGSGMRDARRGGDNSCSALTHAPSHNSLHSYIADSANLDALWVAESEIRQWDRLSAFEISTSGTREWILYLQLMRFARGSQLLRNSACVLRCGARPSRFRRTSRRVTRADLLAGIVTTSASRSALSLSSIRNCTWRGV
jgi:hypothetical protein